MRLVRVPREAAPVGSELTTLPAPAGCDFSKPLHVAKVHTERGVNQYTVAVELEPGDREAIELADGLFTITFFGAAPLFLVDVIGPSSSGSVVASSSSDREDPGAVEGELGTTGRPVMDSPYSTRRPSQPRENGDASDASGRPSPLSSPTCASASPAPFPFAAVAVLGGAHGTVDDRTPPSGSAA